MSRVAITGSGGFLGWHTRVALRARGDEFTPVAVGGSHDVNAARGAVSGSSQVIHIAGVNRASESEIADGNRTFAEQLASAIRTADAPPRRVAYANSVQAEGDSIYGNAKREAAEILAAACDERGVEFSDVRLPNVFGEHGRPDYNSVFATFATRIAAGDHPRIDADREIPLVHAQDGADVLVGDLGSADLEAKVTRITVSALAEQLGSLAEIYRRGEIPDVSTPFARDLFNSYRAYTTPGSIPIHLTRHADARGSFFEIIKSHGGDGQTSFSTTVPGVVRGDHFHRRKIERFVVLSGSGEITLRRIFTDEVIRISVTGDQPVAVDMPTMWSHNIRNSGTEPLYTAFWTNDLFDPDNPDTIPETV